MRDRAAKRKPGARLPVQRSSGFWRDRLQRRWPVLLLMVAPLFILSPFLFFGYTLGQSEYSSDKTHPYGGVQVVSIADPAGSALLDEPYLVLLEREMEHGRLPLLNMKNGLGAGGVESLLVGTFYVLNPLLLALPMSKPVYYDIFQIVHVLILLSGLYLALRYYASPAVAAMVSILVVFSGVTYVWVNMEHYRSFAWMPWMLVSAVGIARGTQVRRNAWIGAFALVASITAGNVQEGVCDFGAVICVFAMEWAATHRERLRAALVFASVAFGAVLIASIAVLPYLFSLRAGNLFATNDPERSVRPYDGAFLLSWILPRVNGFYPYLFLRNRLYWPHADLSTAAVFFFVCGALYGVWSWRRGERSPTQFVCLGIPLLMVLAFAKIISIRALYWVRYVPFAGQIFFAKYYLFVFVLASIVMAVGLEQGIRLPPGRRRRLAAIAAAVVGAALAAAVVYLRWRSNYSLAGVPQEVLDWAIRQWAVSVAVFLIAAALVYRQPRGWRPALAVVIVFQSWALLPPGFGKRREAFPGLAPAPMAQARTLALTPPDDNLFTGVESVTLYDAIVNTHFRSFMTQFFDLTNAAAIYQVSDSTLTPAQFHALEAIGTARIEGYNVEDPSRKAVVPGEEEAPHPLPRAFILRQRTFESLAGGHFSRYSIDSILRAIRNDVAVAPQPESFEGDETTLHLKLPQSAHGVLVINQAYSTYWKLGSRGAQDLLDLWPAWPLDGSQSREVEIHYWPTGLTAGIGLACLGAVFLFGLDFLYLRRQDERNAGRAGS